jgi:Cu(I)/Ag(I) efflux system membrane protein CusA/SilA
MNGQLPQETTEQRSLIGRAMRFCITNKLPVFLAVVMIAICGVVVAPFDWNMGNIVRRPVPVDAIPDIGENQQIVFTEWAGRSPQDIEDQITYPLTVSLLGVPGVKTVRSQSFFGFSSVYVIFKDNIDFYFSRTRVLEKLGSLPAGTLPAGVSPTLGPDATALGQVFWYTLEGRDPQGTPAGGWDAEELRTIQDWYVRYGLQSADGVSEVASVGGFQREYQVDVNPDAMRAYNVSLNDVFEAVSRSNLDVGAKTIELNRVEYFIRGIGFIKSISDIEQSVIKATENVPVLVRDVANVTLGPALRRGALDKEGAEAVGGVVVTRYGGNPLEVIKNVKKKIEEITPGLPTKVFVDFTKTSAGEVREFAANNGFEPYESGKLNQSAWLDCLRNIPEEARPAWATLSTVTIVPYYDRAGLIYETLGTLKSALSEEILITIIVVLLMVMHLRSSVLISGLLPLAVLMCFIAMKLFGVDANIVALSGIAIAIGTMVDMGIVICENILRHLDEAAPEESRLEVVHRAASEVAGAVFTAVSTTVVSFLPVFTMTGAEGKMFKPLAFTKTFALISSVIVALAIIPPAAHILFCHKRPQMGRKIKSALHILIAAVAVAAGLRLSPWAGAVLLVLGAYYISGDSLPQRIRKLAPWIVNSVAVVFVAVLLAKQWEPAGAEASLLKNFIMVAVLVGVLIGLFSIFQRFYPQILGWCLRHKLLFLSLPAALLVAGFSIWAGLGKEFMPPLDEGSFLYMPTTMAHASIGESMDILSKQNMAIRSIPEVESVVGKVGRADTSLDPAPVSMIETVINYKPEYRTGKDGRRLKFRYDKKARDFVRDNAGELIEDSRGRPFRQWRESIKTPDDIWREITKAASIPGTTSAPKLQPIAARIVMLQSGMRAPMGVKIKGPSLEAIEKTGLEIEQLLKEVPGVEPAAVFADRIVGKPYLEIIPDRQALARYGVTMSAFQNVVETAIGGRKATTTIEGRERFSVRVRYERELRDSFEALGDILLPAGSEAQIPIKEVARIEYVRGPQVIKSEDTFLTGYVLFDKKDGLAEVDVVERCRAFLSEKNASGELIIPAGVSYSFAGNYENQIRSQKTLSIVMPIALCVIFLLLYMQFKSTLTTALVFSGILVAWSGGFLMLWLYSQGWFLDFNLLGVNMRQMFQAHPINLSVAVWVGFLALFGIASDDGVVMGTYLEQSFRENRCDTVEQLRQTTILAGTRRIRACLMTTATTILALLPVLTSTGRGSDVMVPMAIPSFGGMTIEVITMLVVPVLYCWIQEARLAQHGRL